MVSRLISLLFVCFLGISAKASGPEITFEKTSHDFGTISSNNGAVSCTYEFTNTGDAPLVIVSVTNGGCGCTKPSFTIEPIKAGGRGQIKITFNPEGRRGEFNREVKVRTNVSNKRLSLHFNGVIVP